MAQFIKALALYGGIAIYTSALAQGNPVDLPNLPVINGHVTPDQFQVLSSNQSLRNCAEPQCAALRSLLSSYDQLRRFYTPNTMARSEDNPPATARSRLPVQEALRVNPNRLGVISSDLVIIARDVPQWSSELLTIEIATLADPSGQTVHQVIRAIPKVPALIGVVHVAHERCEANGEQGCKAIQNAG